MSCGAVVSLLKHFYSNSTSQLQQSKKAKQMAIKNPNGSFVKYYREAKMLSLQILLNLSFINKADAGAKLEVANRRMQKCRSDDGFDTLLCARNVREIDANMEVIRAAYLRAAPNR